MAPPCASWAKKMQDLRIERNLMQYPNAMTNSHHFVLRTIGVIALIWAMPLTHQAQDSGIILTVGDETVTADDFQHVFLKNNRDSVITTAALDEYMELFINFAIGRYCVFDVWDSLEVRFESSLKNSVFSPIQIIPQTAFLTVLV